MRIFATAVFCFALVVSAGCRRKPAPAAARPPDAPMIYEIRVGDQTYEDRLLRGFYESTGGWRWTARTFAVSLDAPPPLEARTFLDFDFDVPVELLNEVRSVTLAARVNGKQLGKPAYTKPGRYQISLEVPLSLLKQTPALVEFELDKAVKDPATGREQGIIAVTAALKHPDDTFVTRAAATARARQGYLEVIKRRRMRMPAEKQNELMKLFHELDVWRDMWFHNVPIEKNPLDLWMMQQIIYEIQPDFVVETGTYRGGSALYWASTLHGMGLENSRVVTVDVQDLTATAATNFLWKKYVTFLKGSSTDPAIVSKIAGLVKGHKTVVTLDSDHSMNHVLNELHAYAPMISRGSYLVVEDTHMDGVPTQPDFGPGPLAAVQKFLSGGGSADFEQDVSREALIMTFNPGGWLRRK
jgi:cephalosporin hydroxylase